MADLEVYEVPLVPRPQKFTIRLGGVAYRLTVKWNSAPDGGWLLDIADATGVRILSGLPLVTGADLLAQHRSTGIVGTLAVQTDHDPDLVPTFENLGDTAHLYFLPPQ